MYIFLHNHIYEFVIDLNMYFRSSMGMMINEMIPNGGNRWTEKKIDAQGVLQNNGKETASRETYFTNCFAAASGRKKQKIEAQLRYG